MLRVSLNTHDATTVVTHETPDGIYVGRMPHMSRRTLLVKQGMLLMGIDLNEDGARLLSLRRWDLHADTPAFIDVCPADLHLDITLRSPIDIYRQDD